MTEDRPTPPPPIAAKLDAAHGPPEQHRRSSWLWIAIACGCYALFSAILFILARLSVPALLKFQKNANESCATITMRNIEAAEASYVATYPAKGYACPLSLLGGDPRLAAPTAQAAQLIEPTLAASGQKRGYIFTITCASQASVNNNDAYLSYRLAAVPVSVGKTGDNGYCSDENNFIRFNPPAAFTAADSQDSPPAA
jgi:type IV pilus assembly protein PilA